MKKQFAVCLVVLACFSSISLIGCGPQQAPTAADAGSESVESSSAMQEDVATTADDGLSSGVADPEIPAPSESSAPAPAPTSPDPSVEETSAIAGVDPALPTYVPVPGISGGILKTVGSDTMNNMLALWTEGFKEMYPGIKPEVDGKGSSNAIPALIAGQAAFGPMSREPKKSELAEFKEKYGYEPTILETSIDMLAVYVNKDNPVEGLSFPEIDAIFSSTRNGGATARSEKWSDFVSGGEIASKSITCYGRNAASGTYGYFKDVVLQKGDYGDWVGESPGSSAVVQSVGTNLGGIGYSGIGYMTADVRAIKLSVEKGGELVAPESQNAYDGTYPLSRFLYLAINYDAREPLDPVRAEFLKYIFSKQGQEQVVKDGYLPISAELAKEVLAKVGL